MEVIVHVGSKAVVVKKLSTPKKDDKGIDMD